MNADGRFAPSPTGPLHLGSLRTALVAWLLARSGGAGFAVRIEDLDPQRSREEFVSAQLAELEALGIDWDGEPVRQSERTGLYSDALAALRAQGRVYPCFCTRAEIREAASAPHGEPAGGPAAGGAAEQPGERPNGFYPGTCGRLSEAAARRRVESGERHALRLRAGGERVEFADRWLGPQGSVVDDFVLVRSDGVHAYQLAGVVDDAAQGIGEVVRGADLVPSTPRQILLQRLLGLPTPRYGHIGLVLAPEGKRLAKRDGSAVGGETVVTLAWLAHSIGLARERDGVAAAADLLDEFDPATISAAAVVVR